MVRLSPENSTLFVKNLATFGGILNRKTVAGTKKDID